MQEIPVDTDTAGSRDAQVRESTVPRANTDTPKRSRRASFESFYDVVEDSIRPVEPLARSQAPTSLSQLLGDNAPAPRPSTRATTRATEKPQAQRLLNRSLAAQAYRERLTAKEFATDFDSSHPGLVEKQTKALPGEPSSVIQATRRRLSSPTRPFSKVGVLNGDHVPLPDIKHAPYTANREVFLRPPTETQLMRDVDIFRHVSTRHVARTMLQKWCALGFEAKIHHKGMARRANSHDLGILMRQGFQQWRTKFLQRKKDVETRHFFKSLERRASKARDLYLLAKAFTHWAQIASEHVDRTSAVRRHLLELKCFNAWYEVTIINDLKVRQHRLSRCLQIWKQSHARTETSHTQAIVLYNECLVKAAYWRWFWTFCERRAPEWRAGKLKKNLFGNWASRQHNVSHEQQLVADLRTEKIVRWSFLKWLESTRAILMRSREATSFERQNCLVHALEAWKLQWRYTPRVQQISNIVDWRVAGTTFAAVVTRYRASRQADNVRRLRILRNSWTKWNDALRQGYLAKRIDDRVLTEQLYKWALAHRCGLIRRSCERRLKSRVMSRLITGLLGRKEHRENACRSVKLTVDHNLARTVLSHWSSKTAINRQSGQLAFNFYALRIAQEILPVWSMKASHLQRLNRDAERAAIYLPVCKYLKCWQIASTESKRSKRRNGYIQVRKNSKMKLAAKILHQWQKNSNIRQGCYGQAYFYDQRRLLNTGAGLFDQWKSRANLINMHDRQASQHYSLSIAGQYLRQWSNSLLAQWRMEDLAQLNNEMRVSHIAFGWLHRLRLRAIETRGREANAQSLRKFYEKRRSLAVLRRWREMAAKRNHHTRREPSSVGSKKRDLSFDADLPFEASLARAENSTHIHQGLDPRPWVAAIDSNLSTTLFSDYLSTPSKRATRAKELLGPSTTPAGTPFGSGLRSLFTTSQPQRKRELGKSTNLGRSAFETIPEVSPRTPSA